MTAAYLASALTGLNEDARRTVFAISDVVSAACADAGITLYEPRSTTDPVHHPEVPDREVYLTDQARVLQSDLFIMLADEPSTGAGQELTMAASALLPVLVIAHAERRLSRMVTGVLGDADLVLRYTDLPSLTRQMPGILQAMGRFTRRPVVRAGIGPALQRYRIAAGLSRVELCAAVAGGQAMSVDQLTALESLDDRSTNPTLVEIRALASALKVPAASLLDP